MLRDKIVNFDIGMFEQNVSTLFASHEATQPSTFNGEFTFVETHQQAKIPGLHGAPQPSHVCIYSSFP